MAEAVVTLAARKKILRARAGEITLAKIEGFAFGDGGVDDSGNVIMPSTEQTDLNHELLRKSIDRYLMLSDTQCRYECTLACSELVDKDISEIAVYDEDGDLIAIKNFKPKSKDGDLEMTFQIDDIF